MAGVTRNFSNVIGDVFHCIDAKPGHKVMGISLLLARGRTIVVADTAVTEMPTSEEIADIAIEAAGVTRNGSRLNKVLVLRLDQQTLNDATKERAAEGILAYSAICPHAGCEITGWSAERKIIECPCHSSHYDPREAGAVIDGPTPRPLAGLPLKIADGKLVVAKPFTGRVGIINN